MKKLLVSLMALAMIALTACTPTVQPASPSPSASTPTSATPSASSTPTADNLPTKGYKIAYILNVTSTDIFQMAVAGATETAKALGMTLDVYFTDVDNVKFQDYVNTCANQGYDAMLLSHGNQETAYDLVKMLVDKGIKVVCFDTKLVDSSGKETSIPGVTQMFQDDQKLADMLLDYVCNTLYADKKEPINILKIWRGPGIAPFDRRQESYLKYEQEGKINTLEVLGPIDPANAEASMAQVVAAALPKYPGEKIDAIWSCYDAYARGAYVAMMEAGRKDIPLVSVDISNQDINYMREDGSGWKACSTVDFTTIGQQGVRLLAMKLAGEETEAVYKLAPSLVLAEMLTSDSNVLNLKDTVEGYGVNDDHISDWMAPYLKK